MCIFFRLLASKKNAKCESPIYKELRTLRHCAFAVNGILGAKLSTHARKSLDPQWGSVQCCKR